MAEPSDAPRVKLICGMISSSKELFDSALVPLTRRLGAVDLVSEVMDFDFTHYYDEEMGSPLFRRFVSFEQLTSPDALVEAKEATNGIERSFVSDRSADGSNGPTRPINLDPGYAETSKLVLASMKNFSHRIYLDRGVYAEVTLIYHKDHWKSLAWTFPDFASGRYHPFLSGVRDRLCEQLREERRT